MLRTYTTQHIHPTHNTTNTLVLHDWQTHFLTEKQWSEIIYSCTPEREWRRVRRLKTTEAPRGWPRGNNTSSETSRTLCTSLRATRKCLWTFESALNCSRTSPHRYHGHYTFVPPQHSSPVNTHIHAPVPIALRWIESSGRTTTPRPPP